jgi:branched-chain amino acid transport system ATP-binding protein
LGCLKSITYYKNIPITAEVGLREINQQGTTILLVEQNARIALKYAHRGYVLETGNIVLEGSAKDLAHNEDIKKAYLGE